MSDVEIMPSGRKPLHFSVLLVISFVVFNATYVIDQTARWTDHGAGFMSGLVDVMLFGMIWLLFLLPWSLAVAGIYMWRKWRRFRTSLVLAPAVLFLVIGVAPLILHPQTPEKRFRQFTGTSLPPGCRNLKYDFVGGGVRDYDDAYYLETTPDEVERLICEMKLEHDKAFGIDGRYQEHPRAGFPDFRVWPELASYKRFKKESGWFYLIITDQTRTRVYISICCI